jgi:hypothetical protein
MIHGHWEGDRYIPEPSVASFEREFGALLALRLCDGCGLPLGSQPRRHKDHRHYHPECVPQ